MPPGTEIQPLGQREYGLLAPGMKAPVRVTTDPQYFEENAGHGWFRSTWCDRIAARLMR